LEGNHRNPSGCLGLRIIKLERRPARRSSSGEILLPLLTFRDGSNGWKGLLADLDGDLWVSCEIVVPVGVLRRAGVGGNHDQTVTIGLVVLGDPQCQ